MDHLRRCRRMSRTGRLSPGTISASPEYHRQRLRAVDLFKEPVEEPTPAQGTFAAEMLTPEAIRSPDEMRAISRKPRSCIGTPHAWARESSAASTAGRDGVEPR